MKFALWGDCWATSPFFINLHVVVPCLKRDQWLYKTIHETQTLIFCDLKRNFFKTWNQIIERNTLFTNAKLLKFSLLSVLVWTVKRVYRRIIQINTINDRLIVAKCLRFFKYPKAFELWTILWNMQIHVINTKQRIETQTKRCANCKPLTWISKERWWLSQFPWSLPKQHSRLVEKHWF